MSKRQKHLDHVVTAFNSHIGHTLTYKPPNTLAGTSFVLKRAVVLMDSVFLHAENEAFPNHYSNAMFECSCGEGKSK